MREGAQVAIVGAPNVGKSSLFNALLNANRAIVTAVPGTTRDLVTERTDMGGLMLALVDTAGVRESSDVVEQEGVARARAAAGVAELVLVMLDRSRPLDEDDRAVLRDTERSRRLVVVNKSDLPSRLVLPSDIKLPSRLALPSSIPLPSEHFAPPDTIEISVRTGEGLDTLRTAITAALAEGESLRDRPVVSNVRHTMLLERARTAIERARTALDGEVPEEFPLVDLQEAAAALQEITGRRTTEDLLRNIFEKFCIGK